MSVFLKILIAATLGLALGLWATAAALDRGFLFGAVEEGPWTAWPAIGSPGVDPYARAVIARRAIVPLSPDQGAAFFAAADSDQRPLDGACDYALAGPEPGARFWSLGLFDPAGNVVANAADRFVLTSQDVVRADGRIAVEVSASPRPGNWLPSPSRGPFVLVLTYYESRAGGSSWSRSEIAAPVVRRTGCR